MKLNKSEKEILKSVTEKEILILNKKIQRIKDIAAICDSELNDSEKNQIKELSEMIDNKKVILEILANQ